MCVFCVRMWTTFEKLHRLNCYVAITLHHAGIQGTADDCYDASCGANPSQVIRNTTLNPVRILPNFINANNVQVAGIDLDVGKDIETDVGLFNFTVATAWIREYDATTASGTIDAVGTLNQATIVARALPEFKTNI